MPIEPDSREAIWYNVSNLVRIDSDTMPHYFTTLVNVFSMFGKLEPEPFCLECFASPSKLIFYEDKFYCPNEYKETSYKFDKNMERITISIRKFNKKHHKIIFEEPLKVVEKIIDDVLELLRDEEDGDKMSLFDLEEWLIVAESNQFFETINGEITKSEVKRKLYKVKEYIIDILSIIKDDIHFQSAVRTPSLNVGV